VAWEHEVRWPTYIWVTLAIVAVCLAAADIRPAWWIVMIASIVIAVASWLVEAVRANKRQ
jgi:hypothetical protein